MQSPLSLGCFLPAAVANQSAALGQAEVEGQQGTVLHADSPQCGAVNLHGGRRVVWGVAGLMIEDGGMILIHQSQLSLSVTSQWKQLLDKAALSEENEITTASEPSDKVNNAGFWSI